MNFKPLLCAILLALLGSCIPIDRPIPARPMCNDLKSRVYEGLMTRNGEVLADVKLDFRDNAQPGFKHNVQMTPPPPFDVLPKDAECYDSSSNPPVTPTTIKIYKADTKPALATLEATWTVSAVVPSGYDFHLHDDGSTLFSQGADGNIKQQ